MAITALSAEEVADRTHPDWRMRLGSVGRVQSGVDLRFCGPDGRTVPAGQAGEIMVRGDLVMGVIWSCPATGATQKVPRRLLWKAGC